MIVSILADLSVLMGAVLFFFLSRKDSARNDVYTGFDRIKFIFSVTVVGVLLMNYSVVLDGIRYDYRFLLYALSLKFLGGKVTYPSVVFITIFRLFWGMDIHMITSIVYGVLVIVTSSFVYMHIEKAGSDFTQVVFLSFYYLLIGAVINVFVYHDLFKDGHIYFILATSSVVMVFIFMWIQKQIFSIYEKSETDYLTSLLNSRRFYLDIAQGKNTAKMTAISMLDIDYFKQINDEYGHLAGDDVLRKVTQVFLEYQEKNVTFYRMGGEEFSCIFQELSIEKAITLMKDIREKVANLDVGLTNKKEKRIHVTLSIGLTKIDSKQEIYQSLKKADDALYFSKATGRNKVSLAYNNRWIVL